MKEVTKEAWEIRRKLVERCMEHCSELTPEQVMTVIDLYKEVSKTPSNALLTIMLENETSAPKVIYKGEEIKYKTNVSFEWETKTDDYMGGLTYVIEHHEVGGYPTTQRIERRVMGHVL